MRIRRNPEEMVPFLKKTAVLLAILTLFTGCGKKQEIIVPTHVVTEATEAPVETQDPKEVLEELTTIVTAGDIYQLDHYKKLKKVDLSGSTCYAALADFVLDHPHIEVTYTVDLGGSSVSNRETSATLAPGSFQFETLLENLQYLPGLTAISLPDIGLNAEQIHAILEAYPGVSLDYTVNLLGNSYDIATTELDLTGMGSSQVHEACPKLGLLTNLSSVKLSDSLSKSDVAQLQNANPNATFHYNFSLFGKSLSTTTETVEYKNQTIGDDKESELREALAILDNCSRFVLDNCKFSNEVLANVREDFREGPNLVWRVYFGTNSRYNTLTDAETIRAVYNVTDATVTPLKYCEGAKYIDMGHNETLTDLSFVAGMPNLEVLIISGCAVKELVGFENCKKLTWLELAYCYKLENIDSLAGCENLTYLNLSFTKVSNFMALDACPLKRFVCLSPKAPTKEQNTFVGIHEGCLTVFYGYSNPYGYGWRYDDNGKTFNEYYKTVVREAFNYDYLEQFLPKEDKKS